MQIKALCNPSSHARKQRWECVTKTLLVMRSTIGRSHGSIKKTLIMSMNLTGIILLAGFLQVSARSAAQTVTYQGQAVPLTQVFSVLKKQTGYVFFYNSRDLEGATPVTVNLRNATLENALKAVLAGQALRFVIKGNTILITRPLTPVLQAGDTTHLPHLPPTDIRGRITDSLGNPLNGASVYVQGTSLGTATNIKGEFLLKDLSNLKVTLEITCIGYEKLSLNISLNNGVNHIRVVLKQTSNKLDESVVIAYGKTTRRLNTGSVAKLSAQEISEQPIANPLAALEGRIAGLQVTQSSGISGSSFKVQIRGQNSITQGNSPLFIIDGMPLAANNNNISQTGGPFSYSSLTYNNGLSPLNSINPADIESIEVLRDADATAIYGSRGANGVILITTKKGRTGKTKFDFDASTGGGVVTHTPQLLSTAQYVKMRREAFSNDGVTPTSSNAYDFLVWDTTRYTNFPKMLIGGTSNLINADGSISGGDSFTQFLIGGTLHRETTVYPGDNSDTRGSGHVNLSHHSVDQKFSMTFNASYSSDINNLPGVDLTEYINAVPNLPALYDSVNNLNWSSGGHTISNPLSHTKQSYSNKIDNLITSMQLSYAIIRDLAAKVNLGYNSMTVYEVNAQPISSQNPANNPTGISIFGNSSIKGVTVEPQLEYQKRFGLGTLDALLGGTWLQNTSNALYTRGTGYTNDALLQSTTGAGTLTSNSNYSQYRYAALFGRINYNWDNKFLVNLTYRRDGSSRFGPGKQFANFGAVGAGYIFSNERFFKDKLPALSYGKIRGSYGVTGNDQIGDYQYLSTYSATSYPYQGVPGLYPTHLYNSTYGWETNKKLEAALELGFLQDRLLLTGAIFRNKSGNQLTQYSLPTQTGFSSITENLAALVQNTGFEFELTTTNVKWGNFSWATSLNLTFPNTKLLSFPNLINSSYRYNYAIGKSLNIGNGFIVQGVNPNTGVYEFASAKGGSTSSPAYPDDYHVGLVTLDPKYYGGFRNTFAYAGFRLDVFLEFRKQMGYSYIKDMTAPAGAMLNVPTQVLGRWNTPGQTTAIQKFTATGTSAAYQAFDDIIYNGGTNFYSDASYVRVKNVFLSYTFYNNSVKRSGLGSLQLFIEGQNLFTLTNYKGGDPETQNLYRLPPLKMMTGGIKLSL